jgi:hypothetical protein
LEDGIIIAEDPSVARPRSSDDDLGGRDLPRPRTPAFVAVHEALRLQSEAAPLSRFSRFFGVDPIAKPAANWYRAATAERDIARAIADLGEDWTVLSSVVISADRPPLEYLLVGPPGVIAVSLTYHVGQRVWVGERTFLVEDDLHPYIGDAEHDAETVAGRLADAIGAPTPVSPCIVVIEPADLEIRNRPRAAAAVHSRDFASWLAGLPRLLAPSAVALLASAAGNPTAWPDAAGQAPDTTDRLRQFDALRRSVAGARRRRLAWIVVGISLSYGPLLLRSGGLAIVGVHLAIPAAFPF